jgi:hypothetical protein
MRQEVPDHQDNPELPALWRFRHRRALMAATKPTPAERDKAAERLGYEHGRYSGTSALSQAELDAMKRSERAAYWRGVQSGAKNQVRY